MIYVGILCWIMIGLFCDALVQKHNAKHGSKHSKWLVMVLCYTIAPVICVGAVVYGIFLGLHSALKRD